MKNQLLLFLFLFVQMESHGATTFFVDKVHGKAFVQKGDEIIELKQFMEIPDGVDIFTEVGASLSYRDQFDHAFHLSGAARARLDAHMVELKSGYLLIQSRSFQLPHKVMTANSQTIFKDGEYVISFDPFVGKTQTLVIRGEAKLANILRPKLGVQIQNAQFSFIKNDFEDGTPRVSTQIGYSSYEKIMALFNGVRFFDKSEFERMKSIAYQRHQDNQKRRRSLASDIDKKPVVFIQDDQIVEVTPKKETKKSHSEDYLKQMQKKQLADRRTLQEKKARKMAPRVFKKPKKSNVKMRIFGGLPKGVSAPRMPRKRKVETVMKNRPRVVKKKNSKKMAQEIKNMRVPANTKANSGAWSNGSSNLFEKSLNRQENGQKRHSDSKLKLIEELQNYSQDYEKDF